MNDIISKTKCGSVNLLICRIYFKALELSFSEMRWLKELIPIFVCHYLKLVYLALNSVDMLQRAVLWSLHKASPLIYFQFTSYINFRGVSLSFETQYKIWSKFVNACENWAGKSLYKGNNLTMWSIAIAQYWNISWALQKSQNAIH